MPGAANDAEDYDDAYEWFWIYMHRMAPIYREHHTTLSRFGKWTALQATNHYQVPEFSPYNSMFYSAFIHIILGPYCPDNDVEAL